jgi:predicted lactoylglutathione lyase
MLLVEDHFKNFTSKRITDAHNETELLISLGFDTRDEVYKLHSTAISLGAIEASHEQDLGFMLVKSFHDLDGHIWELAWINMSTIPNQLDQ